jgi:hypothetical protein
MDGFKSLPKMKAFKEGGHAKAAKYCGGGSAYKKGGEVCEDDIKQDKKMIKKAFKEHDKAEHDKDEPTEIKLKKGGRSKKAEGTVKKFKAGGAIGVYGAKKKSGDLDSIEKAKDIKPKKAAAPSKAAVKPAMKGSDVAKEKSKPAGTTKAKKVSEGPKKADSASGAKGGPNKYKKGGNVKKYADGKSVKQAGATEAQQKYYDANKAKGDVAAKKADYEAFGSRGDAAKQGMEEGRMDAMGAAYKKGGKTKKMKKMADGGLTAEQQNWLGGADQNDPFIMARMYEATGTKPAPSGSYIPNDNSAMDNRDMGQTGGSIDDESQFGNISPNAAAFNANIPGAGSSTPAAAPSAPAAPVRRSAPMPKPYSVENGPEYTGPQKGAPQPYINLPANNPGMNQFKSGAISPAESLWNFLTASRAQRNRG